MVVSTHANERGSAACDHTRGVPDGCSHGNLRLPRGPFPPAVAEDRNDGRCVDGYLSYARNRTNNKACTDNVPLGTTNDLVTLEPLGRDVMRPMPTVERPHTTEAPPATLAVDEWGRCLRDDFIPSRNRRKPSVVDSGAAFVQRKGDSFPCLIPENSTQDEALRMARGLNPSERLLGNALSPAEQACILHNCQNPSVVKRHRHRAIHQLEALSAMLKPAQERLAGRIAETAPAWSLHIPLICAITRNLSYPDATLMADLVRGMPIVGDIPLTSALPMKEAPATMSLHEVRGAVRAMNRKVLKSLSKPTKLLLRQK